MTILKRRPIKLTARLGQYEVSGEFRNVDEAIEFLHEYERRAAEPQPRKPNPIDSEVGR